MNWLQRFCQQKAMPLPVALPDRVDGGAYKIDDVMSHQTAENEMRSWSEMSFLGAGSMGLAVDLGGGRAGKYTTDADEASSAFRIQQMQADGVDTGVVRIDAVRRVQSDPDVWMIVMEKVTPLKNLNELTVEENNALIRAFDSMHRCMGLAGIRSDDAHGGNVGFDSNGKLVLFDLGYTYT